MSQQIQEAFHQSILVLDDTSLSLADRLVCAYFKYLTQINPNDLPPEMTAPFSCVMLQLCELAEAAEGKQLYSMYACDQAQSLEELAQQIKYLSERYVQQAVKQAMNNLT